MDWRICVFCVWKWYFSSRSECADEEAASWLRSFYASAFDAVRNRWRSLLIASSFSMTLADRFDASSISASVFVRLAMRDSYTLSRSESFATKTSFALTSDRRSTTSFLSEKRLAASPCASVSQT